jgi:hypothetical protein
MTAGTATTMASMGTDSPTLWQRLQRLQRRRTRGLGLGPALWLALCLLLTQHAGLTHRIHHGGPLSPLTQASAEGARSVEADEDTVTPSGTGAIQASEADPGQPPSLRLAGHFCVLFDGATVAACHSGTQAMPALTHLQSPIPFSVGWRRPDLQHPQPFRSRAPPAVHAYA